VPPTYHGHGSDIFWMIVCINYFTF
jgi:hypothetical protein